MSADGVPPIDPEEAPEHLAEVLRLSDVIASRRVDVLQAKFKLKTAKEELAGAEADLRSYMLGLKKPLPLFAGKPAPAPAPEPPADPTNPTADPDARLDAGGDGQTCAEPKPHTHTRDCYDDPGPGHGSPILICGQVESLQTDPGEGGWRLLPLVELARYGLTGGTASKLREARIDALGPLADVIGDGELAEAVPDLTEDEVDQVVQAHRGYQEDLPRLLAEARGEADDGEDGEHCPECDGFGLVDDEDCPRCEGSGMAVSAAEIRAVAGVPEPPGDVFEPPLLIDRIDEMPDLPEWRDESVDQLDLDDSQRECLSSLGIATLGDLADFLTEDGYRGLTHHGIDFKEAAKVLAAFGLWWFERGDGAMPFSDEGDCPADREKTALLIDWLRRRRSGATAPTWGEWSEFTVTLEDGSPVQVVYDPKMVGRPDPRDGHFEFRGPLTETGYYSHFTGPAHRIGDRSIEQYATDVAREVAAETAKERAKAERRARRGAKSTTADAPPPDWRSTPVAELGLSDDLLRALEGAKVATAGAFFDLIDAREVQGTFGLPGVSFENYRAGVDIVRALREMNRPRSKAARTSGALEGVDPGVDGLFLVYGASKKTPVYAVRARSLADAIERVKGQHPGDARMTVKPDDGTAARLKLPVMGGEAWRDLGVASLKVPGPTHGKLLDAGHKTLGDLDALFCETAYTDDALAKRLKLSTLDLADVRRALADVAKGPCSVCNGSPKLICPSCGRLAPVEAGDTPNPAKKARAKKAGPRAVAS